MKRTILITAGVVIVTLCILAYETFWAPNTFDGDRFVIVSKGDSYLKVAGSIEDAGIIRNRWFFDAAGRILKLTTRMQIGKYRFRSGMSNSEILEDLRYGKTIELIVVTIPEGLTLTRHAKIFAHAL